MKKKKDENVVYADENEREYHRIKRKIDRKNSVSTTFFFIFLIVFGIKIILFIATGITDKMDGYKAMSLHWDFLDAWAVFIGLSIVSFIVYKLVDLMVRSDIEQLKIQIKPYEDAIKKKEDEKKSVETADERSKLAKEARQYLSKLDSAIARLEACEAVHMLYLYYHSDPFYMGRCGGGKETKGYLVARENDRLLFLFNPYRFKDNTKDYIHKITKGPDIAPRPGMLSDKELNPPKIYEVMIDDIKYFDCVGSISSHQEFYTIPGKDNGGIVMDMGSVDVYMPNKSTPPSIGSYTVEEDTRQVIIKVSDAEEDIEVVCEWDDDIYNQLMDLMPEKEYETVMELKRRKAIEKELSTDDVKSRLKVLEELKADGLITADEYNEKREEILSEI